MIIHDLSAGGDVGDPIDNVLAREGLRGPMLRAISGATVDDGHATPSPIHISNATKWCM